MLGIKIVFGGAFSCWSLRGGEECFRLSRTSVAGFYVAQGCEESKSVLRDEEAMRKNYVGVLEGSGIKIVV